MKTIFLLFTALFISSLSQSASAQELLTDRCVSPISQALFFTEPPPAGISCENLKTLGHLAAIVNIAVIPASIATKMPGISGTISAELAAMGLTLTNPAVVAVTLVGAVGVATVYLITRESMEYCHQQEQEQLKQQILNEMQAKYGTAAQPNVPLTVN